LEIKEYKFPVSQSFTECIGKPSSTEKPPSTKKPPFIKPLFIGTRAFMRAAKTGTQFAIYATPTSEETTTSINIPAQYKEFQDIF
jgi:hypothetical protein